MTDFAAAMKVVAQADPGSFSDSMRSQVERIISRALDEVEQVLKNGDPPTKAMVLKQVLPTLAAALKKPEEDASAAEMRQMFREMRNEFFGIETPEVL